MGRNPSYDVVSNPYLQAEDGKEDLHILFAGHSQTRPGHQNGPKVFDYYLIHAVEAGRGTFECEGRRHRLSAGDIFIIEPGKLVMYRASREMPWFYRWIAVKGTWAAQWLASAGISGKNPVVRGAGGQPADMRPSPAGCMERIEAAFRARRPGGGMEAKGFFMLLLAGFEAAVRPVPPRATGALTRTERHMRLAAEQLTAQFAEPVRIDRLAEQFGYNRSYFSRMFKQVNRVSPVAFLASLRVGKARQMLRERPDLSVEQIAHSVGYQDALYFSKQFRKVYGQSPSAYRKSVAHLNRRENG